MGYTDIPDHNMDKIDRITVSFDKRDLGVQFHLPVDIKP